VSRWTAREEVGGREMGKSWGKEVEGRGGSGAGFIPDVGRRACLARGGLACQDRKSGGAQIPASGGAASRSRITDTIFINIIVY
jgi:hypothetical protein